MNSMVHHSMYKDLVVRPFLVKDRDIFHSCVDILMHNKYIYQDVEILQSSYLKFVLIHLPDILADKEISDPDSEYTEDQKFELSYSIGVQSVCKVKTLIMYSLNIDSDEDMIIMMEDDGFGTDRPYLYIKGKRYTESDFEKLKGIILEANDINKSSFNIVSHNIQKFLDEAKEFNNNHNDGATMEEHIELYHIKTGILFETIDNYSIKRFNSLMRRLTVVIDYETFAPLEASGKIEFKEKKLTHYMAHIKPIGMYDDVITEADKVTGKINKVNNAFEAVSPNEK